MVEQGADLVAQPVKASKKRKVKDVDPPGKVVAGVAGRVILEKGSVVVVWQEREERTYLVPATAYVLVRDGDLVKAGQEMTQGPKNPHDILRIQGRDAVQQYVIEEVQKVYRNQGVGINDKHIEVIIRQMLRKVQVEHSGDTELLPNDKVDRFTFDETNRIVLAQGGEPARAKPILLGITRASLETDSFLAAASFQETTRVLTEVATRGDVDQLEGLKENVIIGRLIPARFDLSEEGRDRLGLDDEQQTELVPINTRPIAVGQGASTILVDLMESEPGY
jgi:DNA-directed RNA polymerase subunit beta'